MLIDPNNKIVILCAKGMELEGEGRVDEAAKIFLLAWNEASDDFERLTAAHYVARHQDSVANKLKWDMIALDLALKSGDANLNPLLPSLYLNVARCYEDMIDLENAQANYERALSFASYLPDDGYGNLLKNGISNGLLRVSK